MAHISSEIQDISHNFTWMDSEASMISVLSDGTSIRDMDLRSMVEEHAFQALCEVTLIQKDPYTVCVSEPNEDSDVLSMTFPRKLWKIVESDQFKSMQWSENGTSIVINEELFKKEVLERKAPFRMFDTEDMKSLVRQLNRYGFRKVRQNSHRSASLADFLVEEKVLSIYKKIHIYHNPNFKRGCPQLLVRMKRRIGIRNVSPAPSLVQDLNKKLLGAEGHVHTHSIGTVAETSGESAFSHSKNINMPVMTNHATNQMIAKTHMPVRTDFAPPSPTLLIQSGQIGMSPYALSNHFATFPVHSHSRCTHADAYIRNFNATTTSSQNHNISPFQGSYFGRIVQPSSFPNIYLYLPVIDDLPMDVHSAGSSFPKDTDC